MLRASWLIIALFALPFLTGCSTAVSQEDAKQQVLEADLREAAEFGTDEEADAEDEAEERAMRRR